MNREPGAVPRKASADPGAVSEAACLHAAREVLRKEMTGLAAVIERLDTAFVRAVEMLARCRGRVIVSGVGKSGLIGKKIAATLTSTGTRSLYLHPVEAAHGDMGILAPEDVLLVVSYSGANDEFEELFAAARRLGLPVVLLTGHPGSRWARQSQVVIDCRVPEEACPLNLAPTASTTASLAVGDALAVVLLQRRGLRPEEFARVHPSGVLGRRLNRTVGDVMHTGDALPRVGKGTSLREALLVIMAKRLGCVFVEEDGGVLCGIITDGDLKRLLVREPDVLERPVGEVMVPNPKCVSEDLLVVDALRRMEENPGGAITQLAVVDAKGRLTGAIHLHDIVRLGLAPAGGAGGPAARVQPGPGERDAGAVEAE